MADTGFSSEHSINIHVEMYFNVNLKDRTTQNAAIMAWNIPLEPHVHASLRGASRFSG